MRLIDADVLFTEFENAKWYDNNDRDLVAEDILMDAPSVDAPSMVCCNDCKYQWNDVLCPLDSQIIKYKTTKENFYCANGKRK